MLVPLLEKVLHKESVVVRNFFMTEIIIELGYSHRVMHLADFRRRS